MPAGADDGESKDGCGGDDDPKDLSPPQPGERPIRCECGWWYYNDGVAIRETYWQRIAPYRVPPALAHLFPTD